ncbi:hypothetical protein GCM10023340_36440 [Nocardioides marinquilinus]|uniref:Uncharacterized protein n=1 Tax=Nocardioides marinquilinus TaxID=1210400 RepID=A0ABP9PXK4_9ACTN
MNTYGSQVPPSVASVATQLGKTADEIRGAYHAEVASQRRRCDIEGYGYDQDLNAALVRRVRRHLAMDPLPLGVLVDEVGGTRVGSTDPEVRRLEAPYRRVVVG